MKWFAAYFAGDWVTAASKLTDGSMQARAEKWGGGLVVTRLRIKAKDKADAERVARKIVGKETRCMTVNDWAEVRQGNGVRRANRAAAGLPAESFFDLDDYLPSDVLTDY